jgi:hypothetical protein
MRCAANQLGWKCLSRNGQCLGREWPVTTPPPHRVIGIHACNVSGGLSAVRIVKVSSEVLQPFSQSALSLDPS